MTTRNIPLFSFQKLKTSICLALLCLCLYSCKKDWLDAKPKSSLVVPTTIKDYQALLEQTTYGFNDQGSSLDEVAVGDYYVNDMRYSAGSTIERNSYSWAKDLYGDDKNYAEWILPYERILYTNIALEGIEKITPNTNNEQVEWNQVKGSALFFRAYKHYDVAKQFCKPYDKATSTSDLGIPLRLTSDFTERSIRSSVEETYAQILSDLKEAAAILPINAPVNSLYKLRPCKSAAYAMLARVYLAMSEYDSALVFSDKTLSLYDTIVNYNSVANTLTPFTRLNPEVIFHMELNIWAFLTASRLIVDSNLLKLYDANDLRKTYYFRVFLGNTTAKPGYVGTTLFGGLATDEIYLIRAECLARKGDKEKALAILNSLMRKRWNKNVQYQDITATNANDALLKILIERRKELCFRALRWSDLRRLNKESQFAQTIRKKINGVNIELLPNSPLYVLPIPDKVISLTGMEQNPR